MYTCFCHSNKPLKSTSRSTETETVLHSDNDFATVAYLRVKAARLEAKILAFSSAIVPPLLEEDFEHIQDVTLRAQAEPDAVTLYAARAGDRGVSVTSSSIRNGPWLAIAGVQGPAASRDQPIEDEVRKCFTEVQCMPSFPSLKDPKNG
jgi:diphthine-ammonia ligase